MILGYQTKSKQRIVIVTAIIIPKKLEYFYTDLHEPFPESQMIR